MTRSANLSVGWSFRWSASHDLFKGRYVRLPCFCQSTCFFYSRIITILGAAVRWRGIWFRLGLDNIKPLPLNHSKHMALDNIKPLSLNHSNHMVLDNIKPLQSHGTRQHQTTPTQPLQSHGTVPFPVPSFPLVLHSLGTKLNHSTPMAMPSEPLHSLGTPTELSHYLGAATEPLHTLGTPIEPPPNSSFSFGTPFQPLHCHGTAT